MKSIAVGVIGFALAVTAGAASNWPQFRGPNGTGVAENAKPPAAFGPKENVLWKVEVPASPSSPIVWGDHIFIATYADGKLQVRAHGAIDGKLLWAKEVSAEKLEDFNERDGSPASSTPATDGQVVVSYFGSMGLVCHDFSGKQLWRYDIPTADTRGGFGSGASAIVHEGKVILNRDLPENSRLLAVDAKTGKKLWETPRRDALTSYGTPVIWKDAIVVAGSIQMRAYSLAKGEELWSVTGLPAFTCTTPAVTDDLLYFAGWSPGKSDFPFPTFASIVEKDDKNSDGKIAAEEFSWGPSFFKGQDIDQDGFITKEDWAQIEAHLKKGENNLLAIKPGGKGDITETHVSWKFNRGLPYVPSPLAYQGRLYIVKDGGMLSSLDAKTGAPFYTQERVGAAGSYLASPVAADGRIFLTSLDGKVTVVKAGGDKPEVLHQANFEERIPATMALAGTRVYIRTASKLYALESGRKLASGQ